MGNGKTAAGFSLLKLSLLAALLMAMAVQVQARTWVVDQNHRDASDRNPGTAERPYRTISRALRAPSPGDVVLIRPGVYQENITVHSGGTKDNPLVVMAEQPGTVIVSGGEKIVRYTTQSEPFLIAPIGRDPENGERFGGAAYVTLRGLRFENAPGSAIAAGTGWVIQDCVVDRANYDGIVARGDDILIERTVTQNCGVNGMAGGYGKNIQIINSIIRRCNLYPDSPGGNAGASKFLGTYGMVVDGLISYDNFGSGWWFDWDNDHYVIRNSTIFGSHAGTAWENGAMVEHAWSAVGIWTEGNYGPGIIEDNMIWSCVAAGIGILDSRDVIVRNNIVADSGAGIEFRDMNRDSAPEMDRKRNIQNIVVEGNQITNWRGEFAMLTSIGEFRRGDKPCYYNVTFKDNVFEPGAQKGLLRWTHLKANTLEEAGRRLKIDPAANRIGSVAFDRPLFKTYSTGREMLETTARDRFQQVKIDDAEAIRLADALKNANIGDEVTLHAFGRTAIVADGSGWRTTVYDLQAGHVALIVKDDAGRQKVESALSRHALLKPIELRVRVINADPYAHEAELLP